MVLKPKLIAVNNNVRFENDVKMYGTQTKENESESRHVFENDVKMYGTQTLLCQKLFRMGLRMM